MEICIKMKRKMEEEKGTSAIGHGIRINRIIFEHEMERLEKDAVSENHWTVKAFKEWLRKSTFSTDMEVLSLDDVSTLLNQFCSEQRINTEGHYDMDKEREIRQGIMEYFKQRNRDDLDFQEYVGNNQTSPGSINLFIPQDLIVRKRTRMTNVDFRKFLNSGLLTTETPLGLFRKVWFDLTIQLGCGGQEALRSLTGDYFVLETDENGRRYFRLNYVSCRENNRSSNEMQYWNWQGRMYEIPGDMTCPVKSMELYIAKRNPWKLAFFQRPKLALAPGSRIWYDSQLGHGSLSKIMSKISEEAGLSQIYTNKSISVTLCEFLQKRGLNTYEIMGYNPKEKAPRQYQFQLTSDQLMNNSLLVHKIMYGQDV